MGGFPSNTDYDTGSFSPVDPEAARASFDFLGNFSSNTDYDTGSFSPVDPEAARASFF